MIVFTVCMTQAYFPPLLTRLHFITINSAIFCYILLVTFLLLYLQNNPTQTLKSTVVVLLGVVTHGRTNKQSHR